MASSSFAATSSNKLVSLLSAGAAADASAIEGLLAAHPEAARTRCGNDLPLHVACDAGAPADVLRSLLDAAPGSERETGKCGRSALLRACDAGARSDPRALSLLASRHSDALRKGFWTWLPLHSIANSGSGPCILAVLAAWPGAAQEKCKDGEVFALHFACDRKDADADAVAALLSAHPSAAQEVGADGNLALHLACRKGASLAVVRMLIDAYPQSVREKGESGLLPLHFACACKDAVEAVVALLIELEPGVERIRSGKGLPLHVAARCAPGPVALVVLSAWPEAVRERGPCSQLALHCACGRSDADAGAVAALLSAFPEAVRIKDAAEDLPLHRACNAGAPVAVARLLLDSYPEAVKVQGQGGWLPIYSAAICRVAVAAVGKLLLELHPESTRFVSISSWIPLQVAAAYAPADFAQVVLAARPDAALEPKADGRFSLHYACDRADADVGAVAALLAAYPEAIRLKDHRGDLPVHLACKRGAFSVIPKLLDAYPDSVLIAGGGDGVGGSFVLPLALASKISPPEALVRTLLRASLAAPSASARPWQDVWVAFLHEAGDKFFAAVELVLDEHIAEIELLANATDSSGRRALGVAVGTVRSLIEARLFLLGRFELSAGMPEHASATSVVRFAIDHGVEPAARVALKFMRHREAFEREFAARSLGSDMTGASTLTPTPQPASLPLVTPRSASMASSAASAPALHSSPMAVLPIVASFDSDADTGVRKELAARGFGTHPYLLALPAADRSLAAIIDHERELASWPEEAERAAKQIASALAQLHAAGVVHGDVKPRNIVRVGATMALIDMDAAARIGAAVAPKASSAFAPPELARNLLSSWPGSADGDARGGVSGAGAVAAAPPLEPASALLAANPSMDAWAFGATLFNMLTGASLVHADSADNAVGGRAALERLAEWSDFSKAEALQRYPLSREARSLLSQLLHRDPARRPRLAYVLRHPFFTGRPAARLPGESPAWDVFVSYRVASDADARAALVAALERRGVSVWSDARLALESAGDVWRDAFCQALATSRVFVPILSRGAVNAGAETPARHWPALRHDSPCDNVLLEHRLALELVEQGLCEAVAPVLLGDALPPPAAPGERGDFFAQGCAPRGLPAAPVRAVEEELARQTDKLGLGLPLTADVAVAELWARVVSDRQAHMAVGPPGAAIDAAAAYVQRSVVLHSPLAAPPSPAAVATRASASAAGAAASASREVELAAELAACRAQLRELFARVGATATPSDSASIGSTPR